METKTLACILNVGIFLNLVVTHSTNAQVIPDQSLSENSIVTPEGDVIEITGGTTRGNNLFHSFEQFSVPNDITASFDNAETIGNVFSRVTGNSISNIEGILETQGAANLFLINPNGIIFGENASLNIGGSFLATTAETIRFNDGTRFSTNITDTTPLLTISAPIGLDLGKNPGQIINRSFASNVGLEVQPQNTIALIGGEISLDGGIITANEGRVELGAVGANNQVLLSLDELGWKLDYQNVAEFQDINFNFGQILSEGDVGGEFTIQGKDLTFSEGSFVATGSNVGGNIEIRGRNITFEEGSQVLNLAFGSEAGNLIIQGSESITIRGTDGVFNSGLFNEVEETATGEGKILSIQTKNLLLSDGGQVTTRTFGSGKGVDLEIDVSESLTVEGFAVRNNGTVLPSGLFAGVASGATGDGGELNIVTRDLLVKEGGQISNNTIDQGNGGDINIVAFDSILLEGREFNRPSGIFTQVNPGNPGNLGNAGNIEIETKNLSVLNGAAISTIANDTGNGGDITINSLDSIVLSGTSPLGIIETSLGGIFTTSQSESLGNAGSIEINTKQFIVEEGAFLSANTRGTGVGGDLNINVDSLIVREGGQIGAGSLVQGAFVPVTDERGSGGLLTINATESVSVTGQTLIRDELLINSSIFTRAEGTGDAGDLTIITPKLSVADTGNIDVGAIGTGEAGSLRIEAQDITLDNGNLTAETRSGDQGNITLDNADTLLIRNNSNITTSAQEEATGGDITLTADAIALLDNSNVTANAVEGRGGNIQINTQGIFQEPNTTITATSELGIDGTITFNTPDIDPTSGIFQLPDIPLDAESVLAQNLCKFEDEKIAKGSSFIITGKGGITPTSEESLENLDQVVSWSNRDDIQVSQDGSVGIRQRAAKRISSRSQSETSQNNYPVIQQSQGWVRTADGNLWLVAHVPETSSPNSGIVHPSCGASH